MDCQEPGRQWQLGLFKNSPANQWSLVVTIRALIEFPGFYDTMPARTAMGATISRWSAPVEQRFGALLFCAVVLE